MLCGINKKTGRCMKVENKKDSSIFCEVNKTVKQKRCRRKTERKPRKPKSSDSNKLIEFNYRCPPGKIYNPKTKRCVNKTGYIGKKIMITSQTTKIGGPISLDYYKISLNDIERKILLFGDKHTQYLHHKQPDTIEITTLLKKIIRKSSYCIDFYSENAPYNLDLKAKGKAIQRYTDPLQAIRKEFGGCPMHNLSGYAKCDYNNLRYHNWDLRFQVHDGGGWKSNPYDELLFRYRHIFNELNRKFSKVSIIKFILGFPVNNTRSLELFFDKQIEKSMERDSFKKHITEKDIFDERRKLIQKEYQKCMKSVHFPKDFLKTFISSYKTLRDTDYTLVFTDFYMLCRMFMKFDKSNSKKTPKRCPVQGKSNYQTPQYLIVYAGSMHIQNIIVFLDRMFRCKPIYTTRFSKSSNLDNKIIPLNSIKDSKGIKLKDVTTVDDLFTDFY